MRPLVPLLLSLLLLSIPVPEGTAAPPVPTPDERMRAAPQRVQVFDVGQRIDVNRVSMVVTNSGSFAFDLITGGPGLEFPRGSGKTAVFAAGLWLGARVGFDPRVAVAEYSSEFQPGAMVGGFPDDPHRPEYKVYKLRRVYPDAASRDAALADYDAGAVPHGAPPVAVLADGTLGIVGDQMLWSVYNDANPATHTNSSGGTAPLGVEVQQTTFAFDRPGPLANTVFVRFKILNKGSNQLQETFASVWLDPDVGGFTDDLAGCAPARSLGFCYNTYGLDQLYGGQPPAVGVDLIQGLLDTPTNTRLGLTAFNTYINGTDPSNAFETYNYMRGLLPNGQPLVDPTTGLATTYFHSGDPLAGTGWLDLAPADKRMLLSSGPVTMVPGGEQEILIALILGHDSNDLSSLARLRCDEPGVQAFAEAAFTGPAPGFEPCPTVLHCPRPASYWEQQCAGGEIPPPQLEQVAACVNQRSAYFRWVGSERDALCATLGSGEATDLKARAQREFAAALASACMGEQRMAPPGGGRIYLSLDHPISCPAVAATDLSQLLVPAVTNVGGEYLDLNPTHPIPIDPINWGGSGFGGGAGAVFDFFGGISGLDPRSQPDAFPEVEIRFDPQHPQLAYRFLRLEHQGTGLPPEIGRGYLYGGFREVPFSCWDVTHGVQLEVAFVERAVTDFQGTILGSEAQVASFDSTWAPDASTFGGREYVLVLQRPYAGSPRPELAQDGLPISSTEAPLSYVLWSRLRDPSAVFDPGDRFRFTFDFQPGSGVDVNLILLERRPPDDPEVRAAYVNIIECLQEVNQGLCDEPGAIRADAGDDLTAECASPHGTPVRLDGSGSQGQDLSYLWTAPSVSFDDPTSVAPTGLFPLGTTSVALEVSRGSQTSHDMVEVTVADTRAPTLAVSLSPSLLWPPNHDLVAVRASVVAEDGCDEAPNVTLVSIASDEPDAGLGPEDVPDDVQGESYGTADTDFDLRAERAEGGDGRTYLVCYQARDTGGNVATQCATVGVPHDQRGRASLAGSGGSWTLTIYGSARMAAREVAAASVVVGTSGFERVRAAGGPIAYADADRDGREDVSFRLSEGLTPAMVGRGEPLFARWEAAGSGYLAEIAPGAVTGVPGPETPRVLEAGVWPNPAREGATIAYALPRPGHVSLRVYDVAGHEVARLVNDWRPAGRHLTSFASDARSQLYLYRLEWEGRRLEGKFVLIR